MNRRALLTSLGTLALAGCTTGGGGGSETDATDEPTSTDPETPSVGVPTHRADGPPWDDGVTRVVSWAEAREGSPFGVVEYEETRYRVTEVETEEETE